MNKLFKATLVLLVMLNSLALNFTWKGKSINLGLKQAEAGWVSGYSYRKKITLTGQSGAGTSYQVKLLVGESSGATGENFDLESHCSNFPNDITFTDDDGSTELYYWLEGTPTGTTPNRLSTFWVKVTDSLETNQDIYVYYGKSSDNTDNSDGANTFVFFDDFSYTDSPTNHGWGAPSGGTWSVDTDNTLKAWGGNWIYIRKPLTLTNMAITFRAKIGYAADFYGTKFIWANPGGYQLGYGAGVNGGTLNTCSAEACQGPNTINGTGTPDISWHTFEARRYNGNFETLYVGTSQGTATENTYSTNVNLELIFANNGQDADSNRAAWWDDIRIRKYAATEPSFSSAGSEAGRERFILLD